MLPDVANEEAIPDDFDAKSTAARFPVFKCYVYHGVHDFTWCGSVMGQVPTCSATLARRLHHRGYGVHEKQLARPL